MGATKVENNTTFQERVLLQHFDIAEYLCAKRHLQRNITSQRSQKKCTVEKQIVATNCLAMPYAK